MNQQQRERSLEFWNEVQRHSAAQPIAIVMKEGNVVWADSLAPNGHQSLFAATNLATPLGTLPHAVMRRQDIAQLHIKLTTKQMRQLLQQQ